MPYQGPAVYHSLSGKNWRRDENGKIPWNVGPGWGCLGVDRGVSGSERGDAKHVFRRGARYTFIISRTFARGHRVKLVNIRIEVSVQFVAGEIISHVCLDVVYCRCQGICLQLQSALHILSINTT